MSGVSGNASLRMGDTCLITCAGAAKGSLTPGEITAVGIEDGKCNATRFRPSSELDMHLALYRARPDIGAIFHAHPAHLLALSLRTPEEDFLRLPLFEAEKLRAGLAFVPALPPGTEALALATAGAASTSEIHAVWMRSHGLTCLGDSLARALALAEDLEHLATVQILAGRNTK
jgi:L-fuculose-phosphate aldolase